MEGVDLWVCIITTCFHIPGLFCIGRFLYEIITNEDARKIDVVVHYPLVFSSIAYQLVSLCWLIFFFGVHYDKDEEEPTKCIVFPYFQIMFQIAIILAICVSIYIPFLVFRRAAEFGTIYYSDIFQAGTGTLVLSAILSVIYLQTSESSYIEDFCVPDNTTVYIIITCCILGVVSACAIYIWYAGLRAYLTVKWRSEIAFGDIMEVTLNATPLPWGSLRVSDEEQTSDHEKYDKEDSHVLFHLPTIQASEFELPEISKEKSTAMPLPTPQMNIRESIMRLRDDVVSMDPRTRTGAKKVPDEQVLNLVNLVTNVRIKEDIAKQRKKAKREAKRAIKRTPRKEQAVAPKRSPNIVARAHTYDTTSSPKTSKPEDIWKSKSADVGSEVNRLRTINTEEMKDLPSPNFRSKASIIAAQVRLRSTSADQTEGHLAMIPLDQAMTPLSTLSAVTPTMILQEDIYEWKPAKSNDKDAVTPMNFGNIELGSFDLASAEEAPQYQKEVTFSDVIGGTISDTNPDHQMQTRLSPSYRTTEQLTGSMNLPGALTDAELPPNSMQVQRTVTFEENFTIDASDSESDSLSKKHLSHVSYATSDSRSSSQKPALVDAQTDYRQIDDILVGVVSTFNSRVLISLSFVFCTSVGSILVNIIHTATEIDPALVHMFTIILFLPTVWISVYLFYQSSSMQDRNFLPFELPSLTLWMTDIDDETGWGCAGEDPEDLDEVLDGALNSVDTAVPDDPQCSKLPLISASSSIGKARHAHVTLDDFKGESSHKTVSLRDIDSGGLINEGGMVFLDDILDDSNENLIE